MVSDTKRPLIRDYVDTMPFRFEALLPSPHLNTPAGGGLGGLGHSEAAVLGQQVSVDQVNCRCCDLLQHTLDHRKKS